MIESVSHRGRAFEFIHDTADEIMRFVDNHHRIIKGVMGITVGHTFQFLRTKTVIIDELVFRIYHFVDLAIHAHPLARREFRLVVAGFCDIHHPSATVGAHEFIIGEHQDLR